MAISLTVSGVRKLVVDMAALDDTKFTYNLYTGVQSDTGKLTKTKLASVVIPASKEPLEPAGIPDYLDKRFATVKFPVKVTEDLSELQENGFLSGLSVASKMTGAQIAKLARDLAGVIPASAPASQPAQNGSAPAVATK